MPWERCFGGATDGIRKERYMYITVFVDTRLSKTKRPRKRFQHFRQSYMLSTDRIEIHQSQPASMTQRRSEGHTNGCDRWISIRSVDNTQDFRQFFPEMTSPTFALTDILIRGRQTNIQVIVSGVPFHRDNKYKGRLIAGYFKPGQDLFPKFRRHFAAGE